MSKHIKTPPKLFAQKLVPSYASALSGETCANTGAVLGNTVVTTPVPGLML